MNILVISELRGQIKNLQALARRRQELGLELVCFCGNIVRGAARWEEWCRMRAAGQIPNRNRTEILQEALEDLRIYKQFCMIMDELGLPILIVPGELDAPEERYFIFMQQAAFVSQNLFVIHQNMLKLNGYVFAGFGGAIDGDEQEDYFVLQYSRHAALFATRLMHFLNPPRILVFHTPPAEAGNFSKSAPPGNPMVNHLIHSVAPSLFLCGYGKAKPEAGEISGTVVVKTGALEDGHFTVVNSKAREAKFMTL